MLLIITIIPNPITGSAFSCVLWVVLAADFHRIKHPPQYQVGTLGGIFANFINIPGDIQHLFAGWARHGTFTVVGFPCFLCPGLLHGANLSPASKAITTEEMRASSEHWSGPNNMLTANPADKFL